MGSGLDLNTFYEFVELLSSKKNEKNLHICLTFKLFLLL